MTRLIVDLYLALAGVALLFIGGALAWPVARRVGERRPAPYEWIPVETPDATGRQWVRAAPKRAPTGRHEAPAGPTRRERLRAWWASTAPVDRDAPVRAALRGATMFRPSWRSTITEVTDFIGRPPWGVAR